MQQVTSVDAFFQKIEGTISHPILTKAREIILGVSPGIEEKVKWGAPSLEYHGIMITLAAFKNFAAVWFHKGVLLTDPHGLLEASSENTKAMRKYVLKSVDEINEKALRELVAEAMLKNEKGEQVEGFNTSDNKSEHSAFLEEALKKDPKAKETFDNLTPYKKKEYVALIEGAKQQATKERRLQKALTLLRQGLGLNDKYRS